MNPGPGNQPVWPCAICEYPVTWSQYGIACDGCNVWHHKSCLSMCTKDYKDLERTNVVWKCCKCDSLNCDSCKFRSYELQINNSFKPTEPRHDKTNKMSVRPAKTQISLGIRPVWSESSLCAQWVAKDPRFLHADSEDWSESWLGEHSFCWFCHVVAHFWIQPLTLWNQIVLARCRLAARGTTNIHLGKWDQMTQIPPGNHQLEMLQISKVMKPQNRITCPFQTCQINKIWY